MIGWTKSCPSICISCSLIWSFLAGRPGPRSVGEMDFPVSDSQYLSNTVHPTLELGIEELLKQYFPTSSSNQAVPPVLWLATWLKNQNAQNKANRTQESWNRAVARIQVDESDPMSCCQNLVLGVKDAFWPIQVRTRSLPVHSANT